MSNDDLVKGAHGFLHAIKMAQSLNHDSDGSNPEYARGQAELLVDLFGLTMDEHRDDLMELINPGSTKGMQTPDEPSNGEATESENRECAEEVRLAIRSLGFKPSTREAFNDHNKIAVLYSLFWAGYRVGRYWNHGVTDGG